MSSIPHVWIQLVWSDAPAARHCSLATAVWPAAACGPPPRHFAGCPLDPDPMKITKIMKHKQIISINQRVLVKYIDCVFLKNTFSLSLYIYNYIYIYIFVCVIACIYPCLCVCACGLCFECFPITHVMAVMADSWKIHLWHFSSRASWPGRQPLYIHWQDAQVYSGPGASRNVGKKFGAWKGSEIPHIVPLPRAALNIS